MSEAPVADEVIEYLDRYGEVIPEGELLPDLSNVVAVRRTRYVRRDVVEPAIRAALEALEDDDLTGATQILRTCLNRL